MTRVIYHMKSCASTNGGYVELSEPTSRLLFFYYNPGETKFSGFFSYWPAKRSYVKNFHPFQIWASRRSRVLHGQRYCSILFRLQFTHSPHPLPPKKEKRKRKKRLGMEQGNNVKGRGQTGSFCKPMIEMKRYR